MLTNLKCHLQFWGRFLRCSLCRCRCFSSAEPGGNVGPDGERRVLNAAFGSQIRFLSSAAAWNCACALESAVKMLRHPRLEGVASRADDVTPAGREVTCCVATPSQRSAMTERDWLYEADLRAPRTRRDPAARQRDGAKQQPDRLFPKLWWAEGHPGRKHCHVTTAPGGDEDAGAPGGRVEVNHQSHGAF